MVEVVGPDDPGRERVEKRADYAEGGIPECGIAAPRDETITVLTLKEGVYVGHGPLGRGESPPSPLRGGRGRSGSPGRRRGRIRRASPRALGAIQGRVGLRDQFCGTFAGRP